MTQEQFFPTKLKESLSFILSMYTYKGFAEIWVEPHCSDATFTEQRLLYICYNMDNFIVCVTCVALSL